MTAGGWLAGSNAAVGPLRKTRTATLSGCTRGRGLHRDKCGPRAFEFLTAAWDGAVEPGEEVFDGRVGGATCTGCHGSDAAGSAQGPSLTARKWLWGDGSYASIVRIIRDGVPHPKQYNEPMPPMGGAQLTQEQVSALAAYVWAVNHR